MKNRIEAISILAESGTLAQIITDLVYNDSISASLVYAIANYPGTSAEALAVLAKDKSWEVRYAVARNPKATPKAIAILAKDENWLVRLIARKNPNFSDSLF